MHKQRPSNKSVWDVKAVWPGPGGALPGRRGQAQCSLLGEQWGENEGRDLALETDFHISDETCQLLICGLDRN